MLILSVFIRFLKVVFSHFSTSICRLLHGSPSTGWVRSTSRLFREVCECYSSWAFAHLRMSSCCTLMAFQSDHIVTPAHCPHHLQASYTAQKCTRNWFYSFHDRWPSARKQACISYSFCCCKKMTNKKPLKEGSQFKGPPRQRECGGWNTRQPITVHPQSGHRQEHWWCSAHLLVM